MSQKQWAVFVSGRGSNLQALIESGISIALVVSSRANVHSVYKARRAGIPTLILESAPQKINWNQLDKELKRRKINALFLAGFMKLLPGDFIEKWEGQILNLHPSLLPHFPGLKSVEKARQAAHDIGVTVHVVTEEMDAGPIVAQRKVLPGEMAQKMSLEDVFFQVHLAEHRLVSEVVQKWI